MSSRQPFASPLDISPKTTTPVRGRYETALSALNSSVDPVPRAMPAAFMDCTFGAKRQLHQNIATETLMNRRPPLASMFHKATPNRIPAGFNLQNVQLYRTASRSDRSIPQIFRILKEPISHAPDALKPGLVDDVGHLS